MKSVPRKSHASLLRDMPFIGILLFVIVLIEITEPAEGSGNAWIYHAIFGLLICGYILYRISKYRKLIKKFTETELRLKTSEQYLQMILDNSSIIIYSAKPGTNITSYISGNVKPILGYDPDEFKAENFWSSIIHEEDAKKLYAGFAEFYKTGHLKQEFRVKHKNGSWIMIDSAINLIHDEKGNPIEFVGTWADITAQYETREAVRKSEERFQLAAKATNDGIYDWDIVSNTAWVSDTAFRNCGYNRKNDTVPFEWFSDKLHPEDRVRVTTSITKTLEQKIDNWSDEYRILREDGSYAFILGCGFITYTQEGQPLRWIGTTTDVSDDKRKEAELIQAKQKSEESVKAKSEFLANMSHEIRTPLNGIVGMTDMLMNTELDSNQHRYCEIVKTSSETLMGIINDILDFSKIDAGKLELSPVQFSLRNEISKALQVLGLKASEKNLEFVYKFDRTIPDYFIGDVLRLQQIINNLVGNAIKFTERGEIIFQVQPETATKDAMVLHFTVADSGIGIPSHKLNSIFEEFTQADSSTSRKYGGTGLGLAITKRLVEMMDGTIWVESKENQGSQFHFTVKLSLQQQISSRNSINRGILENLPVLIVEDNKSSSSYLCEILEQFHMKPFVVTNGRDAIMELKRGVQSNRPYALVLLDITLPGNMDGFDVAENIKQNKMIDKTPVIVISMSNKESFKERFANMGITEYLPKPFSSSDILDAIQKVLLNASAISISVQPVNHNTTTVQNNKIKKILLVEDNLINQEVALSMLTSKGFSVSIARNGEEAVKAVLGESFDIVLMDVQMPLMNGYEATKKIREIESGKDQHVHIVGLTANAMSGDREKCINAGMDDYISKPVQMKNLMDAINRTKKPAIEYPVQGNNKNELIDIRRFTKKFVGNKDQMVSILSLFEIELPPVMFSIKESIRTRDQDSLKRACHDLRGILLSMEMRAAASVAETLEIYAERNNMQEAGSLIPILEEKINSAAIQLENYLGAA